MGVLIAKNLGDTQAKCVWRDPEGRGIAVAANIHGIPTMIVGFHADNHTDTEQQDSYDRLRAALPYEANRQYIWMLDGNNLLNATQKNRMERPQCKTA